MNKALLVLVGIAIGTAVPFLCDWMMFGTLTPCRSISTNNNIIIQECQK